GEKITDKGIGYGISLLIMVGILARLPQSFIQEVGYRTTGTNGGPMLILIELIVWLLVIVASVYLVTAVRKVPVQYARRTASGTFEEGNRQWIPLKVNASGVMPIIFAQGLGTTFSDIFGFWYNFVFGLLIVTFTYFYTAITVPSNKMADDLKRSGGFIPGIKPGSETADYLDRIMSLITLPGSLFLVV